MTQMDLFGATGPRSAVVPGWGRVLLSDRDAWMARYTGARWGWVLYRAAPAGWETWEPDLPFGQSHILDRDNAEQVLADAVARYGDRPVNP